MTDTPKPLPCIVNGHTPPEDTTETAHLNEGKCIYCDVPMHRSRLWMVGMGYKTWWTPMSKPS